MPRVLSIALLSTLLSCTALGAGLDPARVGRYSAIVAGPAPEQVDPFSLPVRTEFPRSVLSIGRALEEVLAPSGYRFASLDASCPSMPDRALHTQYILPDRRRALQAPRML